MAFTGGAPAVVSEVFDKMWMIAQTRTGLADAAITRAVAETDGWTPVSQMRANALAQVYQAGRHLNR